MHLYEDQQKGRIRKLLRPLALFAALLLVFSFILINTNNTANVQGEQVTRQAVTKAAVTCYALEGRYAESLQYLIDHYGLVINGDKYLVVYTPNGENLMPDIYVAAIPSR